MKTILIFSIILFVAMIATKLHILRYTKAWLKTEEGMQAQEMVDSMWSNMTARPQWYSKVWNYTSITSWLALAAALFSAIYLLVE